jgi:hypothetical protein
MYVRQSTNLMIKKSCFFTNWKLIFIYFSFCNKFCVEISWRSVLKAWTWLRTNFSYFNQTRRENTSFLFKTTTQNIPKFSIMLSVVSLSKDKIKKISTSCVCETEQFEILKKTVHKLENLFFFFVFKSERNLVDHHEKYRLQNSLNLNNIKSTTIISLYENLALIIK